MSAIFGLLRLQPLQNLQTMAAILSHWGPDGGDIWHDSQCGLGQALFFNTPEARHERLPRWIDDARLAITAEARIDNRAELCDLFAIPHAERPTTPDSELILRAYLKWGEACPDHLLGDWSFAIWHPDQRKLFLARDHHGNTSLTYWQQGEHFAFASDPAALHAIDAPRRLNELDLAQVLISWWAYHGPQTIDMDIQRLPPTHAMTVTAHGTRIWRYWRLEDTPELRLPNRNAYVDVANMRHVWADVQAETTALTTHRAGKILLRGLLAGLFLNWESSTLRAWVVRNTSVPLSSILS
ncbi:hypothetical protein GC175_15675 [bacterium]|nr:hypothetical protein [bacterium]